MVNGEKKEDMYDYDDLLSDTSGSFSSSLMLKEQQDTIANTFAVSK